MSYVSHVISKFGGVRPLARLLSYPPSTVQNWEARGTIPAKHQQTILDVGLKNDIPVSPQDFFEVREASKKRNKAPVRQ